MDLIGKSAGAVTPVKDPHGSRSKNQEASRYSENLNPNFSPSPKPTSSPVIKSAKSQKSASKNPNPVAYSPRKKIRERKFVVAKRNSKKENAVPKVACKCKEKVGRGKKCLCVAYENLRASQEEFFNNRGSLGEEICESDISKGCDRGESELESEIEKGLMIQDLQIEDGYQGKTEEGGECSANNESDNGELGEVDPLNQTVSSTVKRRREKLLEEARNSVPDHGRVMYLVQAFEKLLSIPNSNNSSDDQKDDEQEQEREEKKKPAKWALPGMQSPKVFEPQVSISSSSFCPSELFLTSENLGLDPRASVSSSWDGSLGRLEMIILIYE